MKTLKTFLEKNNACADGFEFAKDLTLEQFLETCQRGDWILWLFAKANPESLKELILAKAHCANTVRHLMTDSRSLNAVDVALNFGEGKTTRKELDDAAFAAARAAGAALAAALYAVPDGGAAAARAASAARAADAAFYAAADAGRCRCCCYSAASAAADAATAAGAARAAAGEQNQKQTADICREFLPIEIWNQSQF